MKRKIVCGRILSVILAATLALTPSTTVVAASVAETAQYESVPEADDSGIGVENDEDNDESTDEEESGNTEESDGPEEDPLQESLSDTEELSEDDTAVDDAGSDELTGEPDEEAEPDSPAEGSEDATTEEVPEDPELLGAALSSLPSDAVAKGEEKSLGANVQGRLYTWKDDKATDHVGLYIYGDGTAISKYVKDVFVSDYRTITDVVFDADILKIGYGAFSECEKLSGITLPKELQTIEYAAFSGCKALTDITIPGTVYSMGTQAFNGCDLLATVTFEEGMTTVPQSALEVWEGGGHVRTVNLPSTLTGIGINAFCNQKELKTVNFGGAEVTTIGGNAFYKCQSLSSIDLPKSLVSIGDNAFSSCGLTAISLPEGLQTIGYRAFAQNASLLSATIPSTVVRMVGQTFDDCKSLATVTFAEGMTTIPDNALTAYSDEGHIRTINIPSTATTIGSRAFENQRELQVVNFGEAQITTIGNDAFSDCAALKNIKLPDSVAVINAEAFENCSLAAIDLREGLQTIEYRAFAGNALLKSITIPGSVVKMGVDVFAACNALSTVTFAEKMTAIPESALHVTDGTGHVRTVNLPSTLTVIGASSFAEQNELKTVNFNGAKVTTIGYNAFKGCSALRSIELPGSLISIGGYAFADCSLTEIVLPEGLQSIGYSALAGNALLKELTIPSTVVTVENCVIEGCSALTTVTFAEGMKIVPAHALATTERGGFVKTVVLPSTVTEIGVQAFENQKMLTSINLSTCRLTKLGNSAFRGCSALKSADLSSSVLTEIEYDTFYGCNALTAVFLPASLKTVRYGAFENCTLLKEVFYSGTEKTKNEIKIEDRNDYLVNATWKYLKAVTGVTLDKSSVFEYTDDIKAGDKVTLKAVVLPADASHLEVQARMENVSGNALSSVKVLNSTTNEWTIEATLTGNAGTGNIVVTTAEGGHTASCRVTVKEKDTARTPVFCLNGKRAYGTVEMREGDRLTVSGLSMGAKTYYGFSEGGCNKELVDALVGGIDITESTTVYAYCAGDNLRNSKVASVEIIYLETDRWGDISDEDAAEFGGDITRVPNGVWIPEHFFTDEPLVYTGAKLTLSGMRVYYGTRLLKEKTDYSVSYKNNVNAADKDAATHPSVLITLKGNYGKSVTDIPFTISKRTITLEDSAVTRLTLKETADRKPLKADPRLKVSGKALKLGTDYTITFTRVGETDRVDAVTSEGVYDIMVTGRGNYAGEVTFEKNVQVSGANALNIGALTISKPENKTIPLNWNGDQELFAQKLSVQYKGSDIPENAYSIAVPEIDRAGKYTVIVEGSGMPFTVDDRNCYIIGSKALTFTVTGSAPISKAIITTLQDVVTYSPEGNEVSLSIKYEGKELVEGKDYSVSYKNTEKAGTATITCTGLGAFTGSAKKTYKIAKADIAKVKVLDEKGSEWIDKNETYRYTKGGTKPEVSLEGISADCYSVTYSGNKAVAAYTDAKRPTVRITGKGNYTGTRIVYYTIEKGDISVLDMEVNDLVASTSPKKYAQTPVIYDANGTKLAAGTDFDRKFIYRYAADTTVQQKTGSGKNAVTGCVDKAAGSEVEDRDIIPAGSMIEMTVTGRGNYSGTISEIYTIAERKITDLKFSVKYDEGKSSFTYTGKAIRPGKENIKVMMKSGKNWVEAPNGSDYYTIVSYMNNVNKGTATITVRGKNGYAGTARITFKITAR